jgi:hypothetical protein
MKLKAFLRFITGESSGKILWVTRLKEVGVPKEVSADYADSTDFIAKKPPENT